jgi:hypothetical protein
MASADKCLLPTPHARAGLLLASAPSDRHIPVPMAGSPLKRARKQGVRLDDGTVIPFPYMPRVADLPPGWRHFTTAQKIEHLIGLDRGSEILSWGPITELDPLRLSGRDRACQRSLARSSGSLPGSALGGRSFRSQVTAGDAYTAVIA